MVKTSRANSPNKNKKPGFSKRHQNESEKSNVDCLQEGTGFTEEELIEKFPALEKTKDLKAAAAWFNVEPSEIGYKLVYEPIEKFQKDKTRLETLDQYPGDLKRVRRIARELRKNGRLLPVFVEEDDPEMFIIEGRHRILAFWIVGQKEIPVVYVNKKENLHESPFGEKELQEVDMNQFNFGGEAEFAVVYGETSTSQKYTRMIRDELSRILGVSFTDEISSIVTDEMARTEWRITIDDSVKVPDETKFFGAEVVTPVLDWEDFRKTIARIFKYIDTKGFITNGSTGLHCSISFKDEKKNQEIDPLKLAVIAGTNYLRSVWPRIQYKLSNGELSSDYVKSNRDEIKNIIKDISRSYGSKDSKISDVTAQNLSSKIQSWLDDNYQNFMRFGKPTWKEKHFAVNVGKLAEKGYVEFRAVGGENYENRFKEAEQAFRRFALTLERAADTGKESRRDYLKKLYKIFSEALEEVDIFIYDFDEEGQLHQEKHTANLENIKNEQAKKLLNSVLPLTNKNPSLRKNLLELVYTFDQVGKAMGILRILTMLSQNMGNLKKYSNTLRRFFIMLFKIYGVTRKDLETIFHKHYWEPNDPNKLTLPMTDDGEVDDENEDFDWEEYERQEHKMDSSYSLNDLYKLFKI